MRKFKKTYLVIIAAIDNCFETLDSRNFSTKKYAEKFARERTEKLSQIAKIYTPNNEFAYFFLNGKQAEIQEITALNNGYLPAI